MDGDEIQQGDGEKAQMTHSDQVDAFVDDLDSLCFRYVMEFDLTPTDVAGALLTTAMMIANMSNSSDDDDE